MSTQNKASGLVLAGGMAKRMNQHDKGLLPYKNQPLVTYALAAIAPLVDDLLISANRNQALYQRFGYPVIGDANQNFDGPLAGILAGMHAAQHPILLVIPCDSPLIDTTHLQRLLAALETSDVEIAAAYDGERLHPVITALKTSLQSDLSDYLQRGERKLQNWFLQHRLLKVDFSDVPAIFLNINTPAELAALENQARAGSNSFEH